MSSIFQKFIALGHHPDDRDDEKLKKSSLLVMAGPFMLAGLLWGLIYFANGLVIPGAIPFCYGLLSIVSIISFSISKKYKSFRNSQLFLILILPFALQISLGGFVPSSAVMYWAIIAPAGAMFFDSVKKSVYWFAAYILLVCIAYLVNDLIPDYVNQNLSEGFIDGLFLMNIIGVSSIVFAILYYFVGKITELNADIEQKKNELEEQSLKLKEMDKIKSRFFANISHEFRTPLTLILGLVNKQISEPKRPADPKDSDTIKRNSQRLLQLINQLLDLSKIESSELKIEASRNDIVKFAGNLSAQFESLASAKEIAITFNGQDLCVQDSFTPIELFFDREKLQKILTNLLANAVKFTPKYGRIAVEVKEEMVGAESTTGMVSIVVSNTGEGIPKDKLPYVFDRFFQVDSASNRQYEGTGIGLALVKELVQLHRGKVSVESNLGVTSFIVLLPLNEGYLTEEEKMVSVTADSIPELPIQLLGDTSKPSKIRDYGALVTESEADDRLEILIVEDNRDLRSFIASILERDYSIVEAVDGIDGMKKAVASIPDLIISDVMMPMMDGFEMCKNLKANEKTNHIPVILLTAKAARENKLEGLETGADDYLVKPFDDAELQVRIKNLIAIRQKLQQKYQQESWLKPKELKVASVHQKFLEALKRVVEKNIDNELFSVEDLGEALAMSRSQIHRKLKALTNQSATTFIRNYRLHRAADLLSQEAGNISEIAYKVGFNSQTYFSSSFQELFGCSPTEYKQRTIAKNS
ncbi:MAG: response regulator [Cyclobacteriaceae bacterium]|nr:response regulator [Cyclobacteriaceae bacterium]MDH4295157.1 response regulator [Cyclobacteriaceae bacterium]MDH5250353.1 response regulator [Cyclobacteriaceae bacterium]